MKKLLVQILILVFTFFTCWFLLSKIDWMGIFHVKQLTKTTEEKLGDLIWEAQEATEKEITNTNITNILDSILIPICKENKLDRTQIKLHIVKSKEINAYALPNKHLIINSELIEDCENPEELAGVISHEIAHMELNHVMKKLIQEIGLAALLSVTKGKDNQVAKEIAHSLSSSAFSRNLEKKADIKAVDYLVQAHIHPKYLANFLFRLSKSGGKTTKYLTWISTHPDSEERAAYLIEYSDQKKIQEKPIISQTAWNKLKDDTKWQSSGK